MSSRAVSAPAVYFPQTCSHLAHAFNNKGELCTALITGDDRLLILKEGIRMAESNPLFEKQRAQEAAYSSNGLSTSSPAQSTEPPAVRHVCMCPFEPYVIQVVVTTTVGLFLFEMEDTDGVWVDTALRAQDTPSATGSELGRGGLLGRQIHLTSSHDHVLLSKHFAAPKSGSSSNPLGFNRTSSTGAPSGAQTPVPNTTTASSLWRENLQDVRMAEFISQRALCVVLEDESIIVKLGPINGSSKSTVLRSDSTCADAIVWRSVGAYRSLAVCRHNHSLAFSLGTSTVVVFPSKMATEHPGHAPRAGDTNTSSSGATTPIFSPTSTMRSVSLYPGTMDCTPQAQAPADDAVFLAARGITASLGMFHIEDLAWHRASTHTLLCVTCVQPYDSSRSVVLYTVQFLRSVRSTTNVFTSDSVDDKGGELWGSCPSEHLIQLIPSGTIPLAYERAVPRGVGTTDVDSMRSLGASQIDSPVAAGDWSMAKMPPISEMHTSLVQHFAPTTTTQLSNTNKLEFLHVEGDGTVRTSSYQFGRQKHASFSKQRSKGLICIQLLAPLLELYGRLQSVTVLPAWFARPVELGTLSPSASELLRARRYRIVCTFENELRCVVMTDLASSSFRLESFLTLGRVCIRSLLSFDLPNAHGTLDVGSDGDKLVAGLLGKDDADSDDAAASDSCTGVVLFAHRKLEDRFTATVLSVAPLREPLSLLSTQMVAVREDASAAAMKEEKPREEEEEEVDRVAFFMEHRCPDKVKMIPALLKACQGDREKLLTQLTAKYGALEVPFPESNKKKEERTAPTAPEPLLHSSASAPARPHKTTLRLRNGCVTSDGVCLYVSGDPSTLGSCGSSVRDGHVIVIPPVALESLAPVNATIAIGGVYVPTAAFASVVCVSAARQSGGSSLPSESALVLNRALHNLNSFGRHERQVTCVVHAETTAAFVLEVRGPLLATPYLLTLPKQCGEDCSIVRIVACKGHFLVNNDTVVGVLVEKQQHGSGALSKELLLYGQPAVQDVCREMQFRQELPSFPDVTAFFMGPRGEVVVAAGGGQELQRWLRCFPSSTGAKEKELTAKMSTRTEEDNLRRNYHYVRDTTWGEKGGPELITTVEAIRWAPHSSTGEGKPRLSDGAPRTQLLYASSSQDYLRLCAAPFVATSDTALALSKTTHAVPQCHPDVFMQLIGMARWSVLRDVCSCIATAARAEVHRLKEEDAASATTDSAHCAAASTGWSHRSAAAVTRQVCVSRVACNFTDVPLLVQDNTAHALLPPHLALDGPEVEAACAAGQAAGSTSSGMSKAFAQTNVLQELTELLPQVTLEGVSSAAQLDLLCIVEALHASTQFSLNVDEAAARFYFFNRLCFLRRRLRLPDYTVTNNNNNTAADKSGAIDPSSILFFDAGQTASRMVVTASYLWGMMSDSQTVLVSELFGGEPRTGGTLLGAQKGLEWATVESAGAPFWLRSCDQLRRLAERMAVHTFQKTQNTTDAALMFCVAKKVGSLAALCKRQNNMKLFAFFSRDFTEDSNRDAASANAFAAVGKNMVLYGAAFFILAGDVRSAAQIILQRHSNPSLALFVLRAAAPADRTAAEVEADLQWYIEMRAREEERLPPLDMWERACLNWLPGAVENKVRGLAAIASHPTAHPDVLCTLRYARDHVQELAHRGDDFLSLPQELTCLMRLARFCQARHFDLCAALHYKDASHQLERLKELVDNRKEAADDARARGAAAAGTQAQAMAHANMQADYNTGTIVFKGFGDSDDDEVNRTPAHAAPKDEKAAPVPTTSAVAVGETKEEDMLDINLEAVEAFRTEMLYVSQCAVEQLDYARGATVSLGNFSTFSSASHSRAARNDPLSEACPSTSSRGAAAASFYTVSDEGIFALLCPLFIGVLRWSPLEASERHLCALIGHLFPQLSVLRWAPSSEDESSGPSSPARSVTSPLSIPTPADDVELDDHSSIIFVATLRALLCEIAARTKNYLLASALLKVPATVPALRRGASMASDGDEVGGCLDDAHTVSIFFAALLYHLQAQEKALVADVHAEQQHEQEPTGGDKESEGEDTVHKSIWSTLMAASKDVQEEVHLEEESQDLAGLSESEMVAALLTWFNVHTYLQALQQLRKVALQQTRQSSPGTVSVPASATSDRDTFGHKRTFAQRLLLCCSISYATQRFDVLSEELCTRLRKTGRSTGSELAQCGAPNGVFLETDRTLKQILAALSTVLVATAVEVVEHSLTTSAIEREEEREDDKGHQLKDSFLSQSFFFKPPAPSHTEDSSLQLLDLCIAHSEAYWVLPVYARVSSYVVPITALAARLQVDTGRHYAAHRLLDLLQRNQQLSSVEPTTPISRTSSTLFLMNAMNRAPSSDSSLLGDGAPPLNLTLCCVESRWLRRYHTHASLRRLLLHITLRGGIRQEIIPTDRMLLSQSDHRVTHVTYDHSSCDSLAWSSESGTTVAHGYREMLAGDNANVLDATLTERNLATAYFSLSLASQESRLAAAGRGLLARRPLSSVSARAYPAAHPHLPFYLACQRDGNIDLYPFASRDCVATYQCPNRSPATTPASFSPGGYLFAVGLADGSVACWRFTAAALDATPLFTAPKLFTPLGVKAVFYCGERSSIVVAVGTVLEPHRQPTRPSDVTRLSFYQEGVTPSPHTPLMPSPQASSSHGRNKTEVTVGEVLLLDTAVMTEEVIARCGLPFAPEHAVYLQRADAVLCVSAEAYMAVYEVRTGALTFIGEVPLERVLQQEPPAPAAAPLPPVTVTAVAVSPFDELVALGTSRGEALVLSTRTIVAAVEAAKQAEVDNGEDPYMLLGMSGNRTWPPSAATTARNVLLSARRLQVVPHQSLHATIEHLSFSPSMLLAAIGDGKVMGVTLISHALRHLITQGS